MVAIEKFQRADGEEPFSEWIESLDRSVRAKVAAYIYRVADGGARKNIKFLGQRIFEIKINLGPGYRVYFCFLGRGNLLLLLGGDKRTQKEDIQRAQDYRREYETK